MADKERMRRRCSTIQHVRVAAHPWGDLNTCINPQRMSTLSLHFAFPVRDRFEVSPQAQHAFSTLCRCLTVGRAREESWRPLLMQRQLIRDVAHNQPIPDLAHLPSQANRPNQGGGGSELGGDWNNACQPFAFAARRWRMEKPRISWKMQASTVGLVY